MTPAGASGARASVRWFAFAFGFSAVVVILVALAAGAGVRGSDQYWYLEDVETLVRRGRATTDTFFPVSLLGAETSISPPIIHNVLSVYLAAVPATLVGAYGGWLVLNVAAVLTAAVLVFFAARTVAATWAAIVCAVAFPLLPVTLWHVTQPLAEASTAFFAALAICLLAVARDRTGRWLAVVGAVGLLYLSRESYLPLLLAVPLGFLVVRTTESDGGFRQALAPALVLATAVGVILVVERTVLGTDNVRFSYARLLRAAIPGQTDNMWFNFDLSPANLADELPMAWEVLPTKFFGHLAEQVFTSDSLAVTAFFWTFNLLALISMVMLWRFRRRSAELRLIVAALAMVAVHVATLTLFQNQVRYTVPALPGLLVVLAIALSDIRWLNRLVAPRALAAAVLVVAVAILPALWLASTQRSDAAMAHASEQSARNLLDDHVGPGEPVIVVYSDSPQVLAYAAGDRPVLYVSPAYTDEEYDRLRMAFPARWLLAPLDSPALPGLGAAASEPVGTVDGPGGSWCLLPLDD